MSSSHRADIEGSVDFPGCFSFLSLSTTSTPSLLSSNVCAPLSPGSLFDRGDTRNDRGRGKGLRFGD